MTGGPGGRGAAAGMQAPDDYVASPCTRVCKVDPATRLCIGCRRSLEEITLWGSMTPDQRRAVLAMLPGRSVPRR